MGHAVSRLEERRKAERERRRAEERAERRREEARERAREEEREQRREQESRELAKVREREFEAAEHKARERASAHRERMRAERRRQAREAKRRTAILMEARNVRREELQKSQRATENEERTTGERREAARSARAEEQRKSARTAELRIIQTGARRAEETARERAIEESRRRHAERIEEARSQQRTLELQNRERERRREERVEEARSQQRTLELQDRERERRREERAEADRRMEAAEAARSAALERRRLEAREREREEQRARSQVERLQAEARAQRSRSRAAERRAASASNPHPNPGPRASSAVLSGSLGWLRAQSRWIVDEAGAPVTLRGVGARGLERPEPGGFAAAVDDERAGLLAGAGATVLSVAIAQDLALEGREDAEAEDYLEALDGTIATAAAAGLHTIVQLSLLSSVLPTGVRRSGDAFEPALPDPDSVDLWALLARRYADEPAVLFDLFRSPHAPGTADSLAFLLPQPTWSVWRKWLLAMIGEIRREHPRALVIARGLDRGADLSGFPLRYSDGSTVANVVYSFQPASGAVDIPRGAATLSRSSPLGAFIWGVDVLSPRQVEEAGRRMAAVGDHWVAWGWEPDVTPDPRRRTPLADAVLNALSQPRDRHAHLAPPAWTQAYRASRSLLDQDA